MDVNSGCTVTSLSLIASHISEMWKLALFQQCLRSSWNSFTQQNPNNILILLTLVIIDSREPGLQSSIPLLQFSFCCIQVGTAADSSLRASQQLLPIFNHSMHIHDALIIAAANYYGRECLRWQWRSPYGGMITIGKLISSLSRNNEPIWKLISVKRFLDGALHLPEHNQNLQWGLLRGPLRTAQRFLQRSIAIAWEPIDNTGLRMPAWN